MSTWQRIGGEMIPMDPQDGRNPIILGLGKHRCADCGAERNVAYQEVSRITHAAHCNECGGPMLDLRQLPTKRKRSLLRCGGCGGNFTHTLGLFIHLTTSDECYLYLEGQEDEMTELLPDEYCFLRTIHVVNHASDCRWTVYALRPNRSKGLFGSFKKVRYVRKFLRERIPRELLSVVAGLSGMRGRPVKEEES